MVGRILARCPSPNLWDLWRCYVTRQGRPQTAGGMKVSVSGLWDGEIILDLLGGPSYPQESFKCGRRRQRSQRQRDLKWESLRGLSWALKMEGGHQPRAIDSLEKLLEPRKWIIFSLRPPQLTHPCQHLDINPLRPISGFWPPKLLCNKSVLF